MTFRDIETGGGVGHMPNSEAAPQIPAASLAPIWAPLAPVDSRPIEQAAAAQACALEVAKALPAIKACLQPLLGRRASLANERGGQDQRNRATALTKYIQTDPIDTWERLALGGAMNAIRGAALGLNAQLARLAEYDAQPYRTPDWLKHLIDFPAGEPVAPGLDTFAAQVQRGAQALRAALPDATIDHLAEWFSTRPARERPDQLTALLELTTAWRHELDPPLKDSYNLLDGALVLPRLLVGAAQHLAGHPTAWADLMALSQGPGHGLATHRVRLEQENLQRLPAQRVREWLLGGLDPAVAGLVRWALASKLMALQTLGPPEPHIGRVDDKNVRRRYVFALEMLLRDQLLREHQGDAQWLPESALIRQLFGPDWPPTDWGSRGEGDNAPAWARDFVFEKVDNPFWPSPTHPHALLLGSVQACAVWQAVEDLEPEQAGALLALLCVPWRYNLWPRWLGKDAPNQLALEHLLTWVCRDFPALVRFGQKGNGPQ